MVRRGELPDDAGRLALARARPRAREEPGVPAPAVRVGILVDVDRVSIGADSGLSVRARLPGEQRRRRCCRCRARPSVPRPSRVVCVSWRRGRSWRRRRSRRPSPDELLQVDATSYRGLVELRPAEGGKLTVVNVVNLEDYVRGVVPNELSPEAFPQIEALKAQAVAARTYALAHQGEYGAKGFDVCATQSCQVYRGQSSEQPLTRPGDGGDARDRRDLARSADQRLLHLDLRRAHRGRERGLRRRGPVPEGRGVPARALVPADGARRAAATPGPRRLPGSAARDVALLEALGVLTPGESEAARLRGIPADAELRSWTERLAAALHRSGCESPVGGALARRATFARHLVGSICWTERAERLLAPDDSEYLLQAEDTSRPRRGRTAGAGAPRAGRARLAGSGRPAAARRGPDARRSARAARRRRAAGRRARDRRGRPGQPGGRPAERAARRERRDAPARRRRCASCAISKACTRRTSELRISTGEHVRYVLSDGRVVYLESEQTRRGAAADRGSKYYNWEVRLTPREVAQAVSRYGSVGEVRDLVPRRIGVSGRVVELAVVGSSGELLLKGLRVRWGLGLRENLFVIGRETGPAGVERFVFTGKGWGHGVGLCQVGAFGMAQSGSSYEAILKHYYSGIALTSLTN